MRRSVLVTGAAGFIGGHMCRALLSAGHTVTGLDNLDAFYDPAAKRARLRDLEQAPGFSFLQGDVRDAGALARAIAESEAVVHFAARPGVRDSWQAPELCASVNVGGTTAVLDACRRAGVRRIVIASSSSVYGDGATPFREDAPLEPLSPYAASKVAAEAECLAFGRRGDGTVAIVRLFSVFGPSLRPDLALHHFVRRLAADEPLVRFGDGSSSRDYTHVDDAVRGLLAALAWTAHQQPCCEAFNVGSGQPVSLTDLIGALEDVMQRRARIQPQPVQRGDAHCTWADLSKAGQVLGYQPRVGLMDGLRSLRRWYEEGHGHAA